MLSMLWPHAPRLQFSQPSSPQTASINQPYSSKTPPSKLTLRPSHTTRDAASLLIRMVIRRSRRDVFQCGCSLASFPGPIRKIGWGLGTRLGVPHVKGENNDNLACAALQTCMHTHTNTHTHILHVATSLYSVRQQYIASELNLH